MPIKNIGPSISAPHDHPLCSGAAWIGAGAEAGADAGTTGATGATGAVCVIRIYSIPSTFILVNSTSDARFTCRIEIYPGKSQ